MELTHHGHSCIELRSRDTRLLLDPGSFSSFDDVKGVDAVLITHQHADHLDPEKIEQLRSNNPDAAWFAEPQTAHQLRDKGIDVTATAAGESYRVGSFSVEGVGSRHAEIHPYIERIGNVGLVISDGTRLFHPGDSLEGRPQDIDYLAVPVSAPWSAVKEVIEFVRGVQPQHVIPIHDALLTPAARAMYLGHISGYGLDGGVDVVDIVREETRSLH